MSLPPGTVTVTLALTVTVTVTCTQYMGKANTMGSRGNLILNILSYGVVLIFFRIHPSVALKVTNVSTACIGGWHRW